MFEEHHIMQDKLKEKKITFFVERKYFKQTLYIRQILENKFVHHSIVVSILNFSKRKKKGVIIPKKKMIK